jgi:hypothetical protein
MGWDASFFVFCFLAWAYLLTVKQDTVKTCNQISETLWEALSGETFRFTFGYLGFLRSFQGPLGQTHNHKPRNGVRGRVKGVNRDIDVYRES